MTEEEYAADPKCPKCGSETFTRSGESEGDENTIWSRARCLSCKAEWFEYYKLVSYDLIEEEDLN